MSSPPKSKLARSLRDYLATHRDQMLALLEVLVRAESPTDVPEAQAEAVAARLDASAGIEVHAREGGKLVVVLEAADPQGLHDLFNGIALMEEVYSAALVSHYRDDPDLLGGD